MAGYFLKIDGVAGESQDPRHVGEIEVQSFSWGESQLPPSAGTAASRPTIQDFHIVKYLDKASPVLMLAGASGQHFRSAVLTAEKSAAAPQPYLTFTFGDLMVSSYQTEAPAEEPVPVDRVSFSFGRIEMTYRPQRPDGTFDAPVTAGWDVAANHKI
jgi:type VI secretion system secreted protein Hcp